MSDVQIRGKLQGKVAIVTGSSSGIGSATAIYFSELGAKLVLTARNYENLKLTAKACSSGDSSTEPIVIPADLTNDQDCERIVQETVTRYNRIDILINAAGTTSLGSIEQSTLEEYDRVMNVNIRSMFNLTKKVIPYLAESEGCIVNVSSLYGQKAIPRAMVACMSKSTVDQFTRCLALDLGEKKVRVNSVNPSGIPTNVYKQLGVSEDESRKIFSDMIPSHPLGKLGSVQDVAMAIGYLASDEAAYVTGVNLTIDGGKHLK